LRGSINGLPNKSGMKVEVKRRDPQNRQSRD
jgi:hypothetical protein